MQRSNAQPSAGTFEFHVKAFLIKILNRLKQREIKNTCHKDETVCGCSCVCLARIEEVKVCQDA